MQVETGLLPGPHAARKFLLRVGDQALKADQRPVGYCRRESALLHQLEAVAQPQRQGLEGWHVVAVADGCHHRRRIAHHRQPELQPVRAERLGQLGQGAAEARIFEGQGWT